MHKSQLKIHESPRNKGCNTTFAPEDVVLDKRVHRVGEGRDLLTSILEGSKELVVMLVTPGILFRDFKLIATGLNKQGHRIMMIEVGTTVSEADAAHELFAADLALIMDLEQIHAPFYVLGYASGSRVALTFAVLYPYRVHACLLLEDVELFEEGMRKTAAKSNSSRLLAGGRPILVVKVHTFFLSSSMGSFTVFMGVFIMV